MFFSLAIPTLPDFVLSVLFRLKLCPPEPFICTGKMEFHSSYCLALWGAICFFKFDTERDLSAIEMYFCHLPV